MNLKTIIIALLVFVSATAHAQSVGYIHQDSILLSLPGYASALEQIAADEKKYTDEISDNVNRVNAKFQQIASQYDAKEGEAVVDIQSRMSSSDSLKMNMILAENALVENKRKIYSSMLQTQYQQEVQPLIDNLDAIIKKYAKDHKLDAIYILENMGGQLAYVDERKIITGAIIALLEK